MSYFLSKQSNREDYNHKEYILDTDMDLQEIPVNCAPGSTCFVVDSQKVFMMNNNKEWKEI